MVNLQKFKLLSEGTEICDKNQSTYTLGQLMEVDNLEGFTVRCFADPCHTIAWYPNEHQLWFRDQTEYQSEYQTEYHILTTNLCHLTKT